MHRLQALANFSFLTLGIISHVGYDTRLLLVIGIGARLYLQTSGIRLAHFLWFWSFALLALLSLDGLSLPLNMG